MEKRCQLKLFWFVTTRWRLWNVTEAIAGQSGGNLTSWVSVCECVCVISMRLYACMRECVSVCVVFAHSLILSTSTLSAALDELKQRKRVKASDAIQTISESHIHMYS